MTESQRSLYEKLDENIRKEYLASLPEILAIPENVKNKLDKLEKMSDLCDRVIIVFQSRKRAIAQMNTVMLGNGTKTIKGLLSPPEVDGAIIRFTRQKK